MLDLAFIVLRSLAVYVFIVLAIRFFGKREIAQLSIVDLAFILLISNSVQNAMVGSDNSLFGGLVAATSLFVINYLFDLLIFKSKTVSHFLQGTPVMLVYKGKLLSSHLKKAELSHDELEEAIREHGVNDIKNVDLAILETDGNISIISDNYQHRTTRRRKAHKVIDKQS